MTSADEPSRLSIERNAKRDVGERHLVVSLDGEKLGYLLYPQSLTRDIEPGHHRLKVHNTLVWKTGSSTSHPATTYVSSRATSWAAAASRCF